jgi:integrase
MAKNSGQGWSYTTGEKGKNRVRAYEDNKSGALFLEWMEDAKDAEGRPVLDASTGRPVKKRQRMSLAAQGITTRKDARAKADDVAEGFARMEGKPEPAAGPLTLSRLFALYTAEVTPFKDPKTQRHDRRAVRMYLTFYGPNAVVEAPAGEGRTRTELGRVQYLRFLKAREEGSIVGFPHPARPQTMQQNVRFMLAVLRWAMVERADGSVLLQRNPWRGFPVPKEHNPIRQEMTEGYHLRLKAHAPNWRMALVMELCRETGRRSNSVRQLRWEDVDMEARTVTWRREMDKARRESVTPLSGLAVLALRGAPRIEGSPWLIPSVKDPSQPASSNSLNGWMQRAKIKAGLDGVKRLGYHGEKRARVRSPEFRKLPAKVQEAITGTTWQTLQRVYDYVGLDTMWDAVTQMEA